MTSMKHMVNSDYVYNHFLKEQNDLQKDGGALSIGIYTLVAILNAYSQLLMRGMQATTGFEVVTPTPSSLISPASMYEQLTKRERDCAYYLCLGMTAREIAKQLKLSQRTIESYLVNIKDKFCVSRKSELIIKLLSDDLNCLIRKKV